MWEVFAISQRGSLTVEAALLLPFLLLMLSGTVGLGIDLYQETLEEAEEMNTEEYWAVEDFYKYQVIKEVAGNDS